MTTKKEERSEYVGLYLTPTMAKQLKEADNNEALKDKILKEFVRNETDWLKEEIQTMDEITVQYRAKLLTIKDSFVKAQDIYCEEIEKLVCESQSKMQPLESKFNSLKDDIRFAKSEVESLQKMTDKLSSGLYNVDCTRLERLLDAVDRFNKMPETEKELIRLLLNENK